MSRKINRFCTFTVVVLGLASISQMSSGADDSVIAVLSSNASSYEEALQGFQTAFGRPVPSYVLSEHEPHFSAGTRIIVAIGGQAALYDGYPSDTVLIYCLAPGVKLNPADHRGGFFKIYTSPDGYVSISKFKELQPSLKRLAVIWASDSIQQYFNRKKEVSEGLGVEMVSDRVSNPADLPDHLRALKGKINGIWLPPDASLVTPKNFATIKEFSQANCIPFYVPSDGLVEQGATASVSASFAEIGALASHMTSEELKGPLQTGEVFPTTVHVAVNLSSAKSCDLKIPPDISKQGIKVFQ